MCIRDSSRADSLHSHVILHEWLAFYSAFLNIHRSGVLTALAWLGSHETAANSASSVYTIQPCTTSFHWCKTIHIRGCHLHFSQNDRDLLRATAVTRGWNGYQNKSQHRKLTLEKKILPPFLQRFEPATFRSRVRRSNHWTIPAPVHTSGMFLAYLPWGIEYCETDFRLNGGRPVNKTAPVPVLWK